MGILPYLIVGVLWYGLYQTLGFGAEGGGAYVDPGRNPLGFFNALVERLPVLLYGQWLFPNAVIYGMLPKSAAHTVLIAIYGILAGIAVVLWPFIKRDGVTRFWALGLVLALLPVCATFPDNRRLIFFRIGSRFHFIEPSPFITRSPLTISTTAMVRNCKLSKSDSLRSYR